MERVFVCIYGLLNEFVYYRSKCLATDAMQLIKKKRAVGGGLKAEVAAGLKVFRYGELTEATSGFSERELINGDGGFGPV